MHALRGQISASPSAKPRLWDGWLVLGVAVGYWTVESSCVGTQPRALMVPSWSQENYLGAMSRELYLDLAKQHLSQAEQKIEFL